MNGAAIPLFNQKADRSTKKSHSISRTPIRKSLFLTHLAFPFRASSLRAVAVALEFRRNSETVNVAAKMLVRSAEELRVASTGPKWTAAVVSEGIKRYSEMAPKR